jgi:hypothetical protein
MRNAGLLWCAIMVGVIFVWYIIALIKDNAFQSGYWKGRADGFKVANMRNLNRIKTDEVFDYEKH